VEPLVVPRRPCPGFLLILMMHGPRTTSVCKSPTSGPFLAGEKMLQVMDEERLNQRKESYSPRDRSMVSVSTLQELGFLVETRLTMDTSLSSQKVMLHSGWSQRMIRCYTVNLSSLSLSLSLWLTVRIFSRDWSTADKCFLAAPRFSSGNDSSSYRSPQDGIVEPLEQALSGVSFLSHWRSGF